MKDGSKRGNMDSEWRNRVLCSDESCIGTIGKDGRCRECGLPYDGKLPFESDENIKGGESESEFLEEDDEAAVEEYDPEAEDDEDEAPDSEDDWGGRTLCSDESCIGTIGKNGRCRECGLKYKS